MRSKNKTLLNRKYGVNLAHVLESFREMPKYPRGGIADVMKTFSEKCKKKNRLQTNGVRFLAMDVVKLIKILKLQ